MMLDKFVDVWEGGKPGYRTAVRESFAASGSGISIELSAESRFYQKVPAIIAQREACPLWGGYSPEEVLNSGKDILAAALENEEPSADRLSGLLPPYDDSAYLAMGAQGSARSVTVDLYGNIYGISQSVYHNGEYTQKGGWVYSPKEEFPNDTPGKPQQHFLNDRIPVLVSIFQTEQTILETLYLCEQADFCTEESIWIRHVLYDRDKGTIRWAVYRNVSLHTKGNVADLPADTFYEALIGVLEEWEAYCSDLACLRLPDKKLEDSYYGSMMLLECTLHNEQTVYGHRCYGTEAHTNFPPTLITSLMAYCMSGHRLRARSMAEHFLQYVVDRKGRIRYRQGKNQRYAASGSEYGQLLWLFGRYATVLGAENWLPDYLPKLRAMADYLLSMIACEGGRAVVRMCAEADTNDRVYDYLQNTLWAIRGLEEWNRLLSRVDGGDKR